MSAQITAGFQRLLARQPGATCASMAPVTFVDSGVILLLPPPPFDGFHNAI
jgi:hypothetical protein